MADITLGSVDSVIKVALKIRAAVKTVRQNEEECKKIELMVATIIDILLSLQAMALKPATHRSVKALENELNEALKVVTNCQEKPTFWHRLFKATNMARRLARVKHEIHDKVSVCNLAISVECYSVTVQGSSAHLPPLAQLHQDAGKLDMPYNSHARSGVNSMTTMSVTGSEVPYGPLSGTTELTFSKLEATTQNISGENVAEGGGQTRVYTMQRIVIKIDITKFDMTCSKYRSRSGAMALGAKFYGVSSVRITGDGRDKLEVEGRGVDAAHLVSCLRRKVAHADILMVENVKDREARPEPVVNTEEARPADDKLASRRRRARPIFSKLLPKCMLSRTRSRISRPALSPAASRAPRSHLFPDVAPSSTAVVSAASPPSRAVHPLLPPVRTAPARRSFNMSRAPLSAPRLTATTPVLGVPHDGPVRALQGCVAMFDGPLEAVIVALTGALFLVVVMLCLHQL